jgi:ParB-like chromosome segregation protein Spo0J
VRRVLIAGHRRLAALQQLAAQDPSDPRWRKVLVVERVTDQRQAVILALVENLHREDLEPQDEASALETLEHELGSLQAVADAIKRSKAYVSRRIRTYQDPILAAAILDRGLAPTTAQEFLPVKDAVLRRELVEKAVREAWDAPQARAAVRQRCESQHLPHDAECCESQQRAAAETARSARSRAVVRQVRALRRLLRAGPLSDLPLDVEGELRALARELQEQLAHAPSQESPRLA